MDQIIYLSTDRIEKLSYKEGNIVAYIPRNIRVCKEVKKDENGMHNLFIVVDYYDQKENPVCSMPYFDDYLVNTIQTCCNNNQNLPESLLKPVLLQYVTVTLIRPAYKLVNHTDILKGNYGLEDVYKPMKSNDGDYVKVKEVRFLVKCVKDNETGEIRRTENIQSCFNSYFNYCLEYNPGDKRKEYIEMVKNY